LHASAKRFLDGSILSEFANCSVNKDFRRRKVAVRPHRVVGYQYRKLNVQSLRVRPKHY